MKLTIETVTTISTDDLEIYCGELPLVFEAVGNIGGSLQDDLLVWTQTGRPAAGTIALVPRMFFSVSQNGDKYALTSQAEAEELRQAVGDELLAELVEGYWNYRYRFFKKKRLGLENLPPASENGNSPAS